jgi:16S rRNA G966 N2-methylase RsmD
MSKRSKRDSSTGRLFSEPQRDFFDKSAEEAAQEGATTTIECLGMTFESEEARREFFLDQLREKLADPEFRAIPGFPVAPDDVILRLSDPPYYTACPNPFLEEFITSTEPVEEGDQHHEPGPFAVDVSVGKTDALYKAHGYHTKVPHLAIVPSILHYTKPGDLVLDAFCGSGLAGVAAQWCGTAPKDYRKDLEGEWKTAGHVAPEWGMRRSIQGDLSPAATFIASNYNLPFDLREFASQAERLLAECEREFGWMYETLHEGGKIKGRINYTVWSEIFACPECAGELVFVRHALDPATKKMRDSFPCPTCNADVTKRRLQRLYETSQDQITGALYRRPRRVPVLINYTVGKEKFEKAPDDHDMGILDRVAALKVPADVPAAELPYMHMTHERARMDSAGVTHLHHFFLPRPLQALSFLWRNAKKVADVRTRNMLLFFVEQAIWGMSILNRYSPSHFSQVNRALNGVYYVASQHSEVSPRYILDGKLKGLARAFKAFKPPGGSVAVTTGDCAAIPIPSDSVDFIFTDPPFGENIYYADLNFVVESWHGVLTAPETEAIVDRAKKKGLHEYQELMRACFAEYHRVLKPGRWMTVVFSNSSNGVWRAIQEAMGTAGFVVADVRTLDKKQGSYRQVTSSAVKQDLVISAYKPTEVLAERFRLGEVGEESCWSFVSEHLSHLPVFLGREGAAEVVAERTPQMLHDRMIAFHVQRGTAVPMSGPEFLVGMEKRYPEREGMYFLPEQVAEFDRKRTSVSELKQLSLFINDEASAIQWVRQGLQQKPQSFQDLQPQFMKELQAWAKHEQTVELKEILAENFLCYEGDGPVPSQIHSYLSTNFRDCRKLEKTDSALIEKAKDRWFVPDPAKQGDLEKIRSKRLLTEFEEYRSSTQKKLKQFRTEAIRAGFSAAWNAKNFEAIVDVAKKIPDSVLQEDPDLLMYYDNATTLLGTD